MFKHILVPTDGSELSARAVDQGTRLAAVLAARISFIHVLPSFHALSFEAEALELSRNEHLQAYTRKSEQILEKACTAARAGNVECSSAFTVHDHPYEAIINAAEAKGCDLVLMASHGRRGLQGLLLGSETHKVLTHSRIPVLVIR